MGIFKIATFNRFLQLPFVCQPVRFRHAPDPGTLEQRLFRAVTKPVIPPLNITPLDKRLSYKEHAQFLHENNAYRRFLIERAREEFFQPLDKKMLLILQPNKYKKHELLVVKNRLFDKGIIFKGFPISILREAAKGTRYEVFSKYVLHSQVKNYYVVGDPDPEVCQYAMSVIAKSPIFILLGGLIQHRLMTIDQLSEYAKYSVGGLPHVQSELLGILDKARGERLLQNLTHHQTSIVQGLKHASQQPSNT